MAITEIIDALPEGPQRNEDTRDEFVSKMDARLAAEEAYIISVNLWGTQANALAVEMNDLATYSALQVSLCEDQVDLAEDQVALAIAQVALANAAATAAQLAQAASEAAANAVLWVTGTNYVIGNCVYSPTTFLTYRRTTNGAGATDPASDTTNWTALANYALATATAALPMSCSSPPRSRLPPCRRLRLCRLPPTGYAWCCTMPRPARPERHTTSSTTKRASRPSSSWTRPEF